MPTYGHFIYSFFLLQKQSEAPLASSERERERERETVRERAEERETVRETQGQ